MIRRKWTPREIGLGAALLAVVIFLMTFYVWYQTEAVRLGLEITANRNRIQKLRDDIRGLELERTHLLAPDRVEKIARESLGLVDPKPEDILYDDALVVR